MALERSVMRRPLLRASGSGDPTESPRRRGAISRTVLISVAAGVLVLLGGVVYARVGSSVNARLNSRTLGVLAFTNPEADTAQEYFTLGVSDDLARILSQIGELRTTPRSAMMLARRPGQSLQQLGTTQHVRMLLDGTVRRNAGRLQMTGRITDVSDGKTIWSQSMEGDAGDLFKMQDSLVKGATKVLADSLDVFVPPEAALKRGTEDPVAYDLYLRGKFLLAKRTEADARRADSFFEQASARDPSFARANAARSVALLMTGLMGPKVLVGKLNEAFAMGKSASTADPEIADAYLSAGYLALLQSKYVESERLLKHAIDLEPTSVLAHLWYSDLLVRVDRLEEALEQTYAAQRLDPASPQAASAVATVLLRLHKAEVRAGTTKAASEAAATLANKNFSDALALIHSPDQLTRAFKEVIRIDPTFPGARGNAAFALGAIGRRDDAEELATALLADGEAHRVSAFEVGISRLGLDDLDGALLWLNKSIELNEPEAAPKVIACDPYLDPITRDVRFVKLLPRFQVRSCYKTP